jgi:hypothetical protein
LQNWKQFRFKAAIAPLVWNLCETLIAASPVRRLWFYSDAQWSNAPRVFPRPFSLLELQSYHDKEGIRFNTAIEVASEA